MNNKLLITTLSVAILTLSACSGTPVDQPQQQDEGPSIEHKWQLSNIEYKEGKVFQDGTEIASFVSISSNETGSLDLIETGDFITNFGFDNTEVYTVDGQNTTYQVPGQRIDKVGTYTYDADTRVLSLSADGITDEATVTTLTEDQLIYVSDYDDVFFDTRDNKTYRTTAKIRYKFTR